MNKVKNLCIDIDSESLHIFIDNGDDIISVAYWHIDEVKEDEEVAIPMCKAVQLFYTNQQELVRLVSPKISGTNKNLIP